MFDDKTEDNTPILNELNTVVTQEPTLEELNKEEDQLDFTKLMKQLGPSLKKNGRGSIITLRWKNQYLPEAAALAAPPVKY